MSLSPNETISYSDGMGACKYNYKSGCKFHCEFDWECKYKFECELVLVSGFMNVNIKDDFLSKAGE